MTEPNLTKKIMELLSNIETIKFAPIAGAQDPELITERTYRLLKERVDFIVNGHEEDHNSIILLSQNASSEELYAIKLPAFRHLNVNPGKQAKTREKNRHIEEQAGMEFEHVRVKLKDYPNAIAIADRTSLSINSIKVAVTAQRFIENSTRLDEWLDIEFVQNGNRPLDLDKWLDLAIKVVEVLNEVHSRRVTHGDFYERNILQYNNRLLLIDFADSIHEDHLDLWQKGLHVYLAPERVSRVSAAPNESSDIYSLGMVLLNLATNKILARPSNLETVIKEFEIERKERKRRELVRGFLRTHSSFPYRPNKAEQAKVQIAETVADLIGKCVAYIQADRPNCQEVLDELLSYRMTLDQDKLLSDCASRLSDIQIIVSSELNQIPLPFTRVLNRQVQSLEFLVRACKRHVVDIRTSRDKLMREVCDLLDNLESGDSWTSVSLPAVWQDRALGLNDRAFTSSINAVSRGAALHRGFVLSREDLGINLWNKWERMLVQQKQKDLFHAINRGIFSADNIEGRYEQLAQQLKSNNSAAPVGPSPSQNLDNQAGLNRLKHLVRILSGYRKRLERKNLFSEEFNSIPECNGLYLGFLLVDGCYDVRRIRCTDPFVLIKMQEQWLLLQGFFRERFSTIKEGKEAKLDHEPELVSLRLFRSIRASGVPDTRIKTIESKLGLSVNCAANNWELLRSLEELIRSEKKRS
jgi:serine/threonine protein kinase